MQVEYTSILVCWCVRSMAYYTGSHHTVYASKEPSIGSQRGVRSPSGRRCVLYYGVYRVRSRRTYGRRGVLPLADSTKEGLRRRHTRWLHIPYHCTMYSAYYGRYVLCVAKHRV